MSVIIPSYNCGKFVSDAVRSVLEQSFQNVEVIVVDDGSTDDTRSALQEFESSIRYVYQSNKGLPAALNTALRSSSAELVAILDADDLWERDKVAEQVAVFHAVSDVGLCYTNFVPFGAKADYKTGFDERDGALIRYPRKRVGPEAYLIVSQDLLADLLLIQGLPKPSSVMFRRSCLNKVGLFDEKLTFCQDSQMWLRLAKYFPFAYVDRCLVRRRLRGNSLASSQSDRSYMLEHIQMLQNLENWIPLSAEEKSILKRLLSSYCFAAGYAEFSDGRLSAGRHHLQSSFSTHANLRSLIYLLMTFLPANFIRTLRLVKQQLSRPARASEN